MPGHCCSGGSRGRQCATHSWDEKEREGGRAWATLQWGGRGQPPLPKRWDQPCTRMVPRFLRSKECSTAEEQCPSAAMWVCISPLHSCSTKDSGRWSGASPLPLRARAVAEQGHGVGHGVGDRLDEPLAGAVPPIRGPHPVSTSTRIPKTLGDNVHLSPKGDGPCSTNSTLLGERERERERALQRGSLAQQANE